MLWAEEFRNCFAAIARDRRCDFGRHSPYDACVSTRKLILTAVACGLAILMAGGVFLVRTLGNKDALTVKNAAVGEMRSLNSLDATVLSWRRTDGQIQARVKIVTRLTDQPDAKADNGWTMLVGVPLIPVTPLGLAAGETARSDTSYSLGAPAVCVLAYPDTKGTPYLAYSYGDKQVQWVLTA